MVNWYRNYYGDKQFAEITENKTGYFRYEITLKNQAKLTFFESESLGKTPNLHKLIPFAELSTLFHDHWIHENGMTSFYGKIHVNNLLNYQEILAEFEQLILMKMNKFNFIEGIDYRIKELGYININNPPKDFYDNYWLKRG